VRPEQLVAVTDPGTSLEGMARERGWRAVFPHPVDVGGRYAALTVVGMLPLAVIGGDGPALLGRAITMDPGAARALGARLATAAEAGRNKLVLRPPDPVASLAGWIEQLVAESSGKDGRGVIPVVEDPAATPLPDDEVVADFSPDPLDLGAEFLRWEYATWELCTRLGVDAFVQPDVEKAKTLAREELERPDGVGAQVQTLDPAELGRLTRPGDYLAILAYLPPDAATRERLATVRAAWARALGCATTLGFGPQYLHSTGQLHKGGPASGRFLVLTADDAEDAEIPGTGRTFGQLKRAQALGDLRALLDKGRAVAHVHLRQPRDVERVCPV
ncbi:MAG: glucose-6-phosphate isomerase, partial [Acidimicrobiales bacterium]